MPKRNNDTEQRVNLKIVVAALVLVLSTSVAYACKTRDCRDAQSDIQAFEKFKKEHPDEATKIPVVPSPSYPTQRESDELIRAREAREKAQREYDEAKRRLNNFLRRKIQEKCKKLYDLGEMPDWLEQNCGL
jgi:hypothetical protein